MATGKQIKRIDLSGCCSQAKAGDHLSLLRWTLIPGPEEAQLQQQLTPLTGLVFSYLFVFLPWQYCNFFFFFASSTVHLSKGLDILSYVCCML